MKGARYEGVVKDEDLMRRKDVMYFINVKWDVLEI